ncbi:hypothetical protein PLACP1_30400 [Planifilum fimeticola]
MIGLYEFQMLYGVRGGLQRQLAREGYKVRVYTQRLVPLLHPAHRRTVRQRLVHSQESGQGLKIRGGQFV